MKSEKEVRDARNLIARRNLMLARAGVPLHERTAAVALAGALMWVLEGNPDVETFLNTARTDLQRTNAMVN